MEDHDQKIILSSAFLTLWFLRHSATSPTKCVTVQYYSVNTCFVFYAYSVSTCSIVQMTRTFLTEVSANCMNISFIFNLIYYYRLQTIFGQSGEQQSKFSHMLTGCTCKFGITPLNRTVSPLVENGSCSISVRGIVRKKWFTLR